MSDQYRYYGIRGKGYIHIECWPAYEKRATVYDALGRPVSRPMIDAELVTFRGIRKEHCLCCGRPLLAKSPAARPSAPVKKKEKSQTEGYFDLIRKGL